MFFQLSLISLGIKATWGILSLSSAHALRLLSHKGGGSPSRYRSESDLGVLDEVEAVSPLNDGVNPRVELGEEARVLLELLGGLVVGVEVVGGGVEEVGAETVVGVEEHLVGVAVELGRHVLDEELHLVDGVGVALLALEGGTLLGLLVVGLGPLLDVGGLDLGHVELSAEGVLGLDFLVGLDVVEEVEERVDGETSVLLVNLGEDGGVNTVDGSLVELLIASLGLDLLGELGVGGDGEDVGVVGEEEHLLLGGGLVVGRGSDPHDVASVDVGELQLEGEDVPGLGAGSVSESELVGVLVELEDLVDLGNDVEVALLASSLSEGHVEVR